TADDRRDVEKTESLSRSSVEDLMAESSLGSESARRLRARASADQVKDVLHRVASEDARDSEIKHLKRDRVKDVLHKVASTEEHEPHQTVYESQVVGGQPRWEHPAQRSFWHSLAAAEREVFEDSAKEEIYWAGTTLCRQDDDTTEIVVIKSGWVKVTTEAGGRERIIAIRGPGDTVGERAAMTAASRSATVVALDDVRVLVISARQFRVLLAEHPHILPVLTPPGDQRLGRGRDRALRHH